MEIFESLNVVVHRFIVCHTEVGSFVDQSPGVVLVLEKLLEEKTDLVGCVTELSTKLLADILWDGWEDEVVGHVLGVGEFGSGLFVRRSWRV